MKRISRKSWIMILVAGALIWYAVALASMWYKSAGIDEFPHLGAGLAVLHYGDFRMNPEHPPLAKVLAVLPAYLFDCPRLAVRFEDNREVAAWFDSMQGEWGYYLLFHAGRDPLVLLRWARVVPALWGILGALFAYLWGRELTGRRMGGALSALLLLTYPEYTGHARLLTLDVPTLAGCAAVSWFGWRWWRRPDWARALAFVFACAVGSQVKLPIATFAVFLLLTMGAVALGRLLRPGAVRPQGRLTRVIALIFAVAIAGYAAAWIGAGFRFAYLPAGATAMRKPGHLPPAQGNGLRDQAVNFAWKHKLLPETALAVINHAGSFQGRDMFLFDERSSTGWYSYFFVTTAVKTPVAMLAGIVIAGATVAVRSARRRHSSARWWRRERAMLLGLPFALLFVLYVVSRPNIGHRQVLFIYFSLALLLGTEAARWLRGRNMRYVAWGVITGQLLAFTLYFPHYETYMNEFMRTPYRGGDILYDSNVDWGTDVPLAGKVARELGATEVNYAAFGFNKPEAFGIPKYRWLLPSYPWTMYTNEAMEPDPRLPSFISVNCISSCRAFYPSLYNRPPDYQLNSMLVFLPRIVGSF